MTIKFKQVRKPEFGGEEWSYEHAETGRFYQDNIPLKPQELPPHLKYYHVCSTKNQMIH